MEYIDLIIVAVAAFWIGYKIATWINVMTFTELLEDLDVSPTQLKKIAKEKGINLPHDDEEDEEEDFRSTINIKVEQHQEQFYAFELEKDTFIAQGKTTDELLDEIMRKHPTGTNVVCDKAHGGELLIGAVERMKERS